MTRRFLCEAIDKMQLANSIETVSTMTFSSINPRHKGVYLNTEFDSVDADFVYLVQVQSNNDFVEQHKNMLSCIIQKA